MWQCNENNATKGLGKVQIIAAFYVPTSFQRIIDECVLWYWLIQMHNYSVHDGIPPSGQSKLNWTSMGANSIWR